jgi:hypothetical protein
MMAAELTTCRIPEDLTSLVLTGGYFMACTTFYEWGFGVPSHQFLFSLFLLPPPDIQSSGRVVKSTVLSEERYRRIAPHVHG